MKKKQNKTKQKSSQWITVSCQLQKPQTKTQIKEQAWYAGTLYVWYQTKWYKVTKT